MGVVRYKNQSEYAFVIWISNFPDSGHPLDEQRFQVFAKTVAKYRNKRWLEYEYFENQIKAYAPHFADDSVENYWHKLREFVSFYRLGAIPTTVIDGEQRKGLYQRGVKNGKLYEVEINENEYYGRRGATAETLKHVEQDL